MTAKILDGKAVSVILLKTLEEKLSHRKLHPPGLAVILVGNDHASQIYVQNKRRACEQIGIRSFAFDLPSDTTQEDLLQLIHQLNHDPEVHGILIQVPLPSHIETDFILEHVSPHKDVDGFHPYNMGRLVQQQPLLRPCTPFGVMTLLEHYAISLKGLNAVVVGASNIVGRPMALELLMAQCTVTVCHRATRDLASHVTNADLLVVAIGHAGIVKTDWIKPGAIVIDVGMNRNADDKVVGDIDFESAKEVAGWITPVPGGVGPMTVAALMQNTVLAASY